MTVSMPKNLKDALQVQVAAGKFKSLSAAVQTAVRSMVRKSSKITVNGFTEAFEEGVLEAEKEPHDPRREWDPSKGSFVDFVLKNK